MHCSVITEISRPARRDYLVFIFVFNEGQKLSNQLNRFPPPSERQFDVMIGDDGSTDGSVSPNLLDDFAIRGVVRLCHNAGLSAIIKEGLRWYLETREYKGIILMNGNDRDDPDALDRFIDKLDEGYDYIQGSRFRRGGMAVNTPALRYWAIRMVHAPLFSLAAWRWMTDTTNGFRAFSSAFLSDSRVHIFQDVFQKYEIEQYLAWKAIQLDYRTCEIPVIRRYPAVRTAPYSKIKPGIGYWEMLKPLLMLLLRRYR